MASLSSIPPIVVVGIETVGVCLLALEVWIGHRVEEIGEDLSQLQRLQFLFAAQDYRGFWIEVRLQLGKPPAEVTKMVNILQPIQIEQAVNKEWSEISPKIAQSLHSWERYTAPAARYLRKISLVTGTLLILVATWLTFLREPGSSSTAINHSESASTDVSPTLSLTRYQLSPFPSGAAEDSAALADEVCRVRKAQRPAGSDVAVVIGRHDPRPLTPAAKRRFGSNLGLAQTRAETVARLLLDPTVCRDSPPIDAIALAVPNDRPLPGRVASRSKLDEERRPDILGLRIVQPSKR